MGEGQLEAKRPSISSTQLLEPKQEERVARAEESLAKGPLKL